MSCKISELNFLAPDVLSIRLRLPPTLDFQFIPGQYIEIIGMNGTRRSYSLANSNFEQRILELHIRRVEHGILSRYWFEEAKVNDLLRLNGPLGTFFLRDIAGIDLIFLATGTGIAPVKSMLDSVAFLPAEKQPKSITVIWGGRHKQDLYLNLTSEKYQFFPVLSRGDEHWKGMRGYVQQALLSLQLDLSNSAVYACGSAQMINDAKELLRKIGFPAHRFYSDAFVSSSPNAKFNSLDNIA